MDNKTTNKVRECEPLPFTNTECMLYLPPSLTLRSHGDVCDEYNPLTSQFIQRIGEDGSILDNPIASKVKSIVVHNDSIKYGYSLPNGVTDLYHPQTETYEQLIESTTLDGSEEWAKTNQTTYTTTFVGAKSDTSLEIFTMKEEVKEITIINDRLTITFKDNSYVASNNLTVNAFKVWLQSNNIEFKYELKYNEYSKVPLEELDFNEFHSDSLVGSKSSTITQATKDDSVFAPITYQAKSNNRFELPLLESDVDYTIRYEGETTGVNLGGETITSVESNSVVQGGVGKVALFDSWVDELMLVKGDVRKQDFNYFRGLESVKQPTVKTLKNDKSESSDLKTPNNIVMRSVDSIGDSLDCNTGEYVERIGVRQYQEGDEHDDSVITDLTKTQYVLETPITKTVDLIFTQQGLPSSKMAYYTGGQGQLISNGTLPKFSYKLQSTNNYYAKDLKPNTTYTVYSDTESSVVDIGGKPNILLNSPQLVTSGSDGKNVRFESVANDIVVIEGDVVNQVVPYFTGKIDVVNPIVKTAGGNNSNTVQTSVTLRSVNGVRDTYDMNTGTLTKRISDNHEILDYPQTITIPCDKPRIYSQGRIELSNNSDLSLLPRFEYSGKSPNFYPLAVDKNTTYTLKFDNATNGSVTLGGTTVGTNGNQIITTKNNTLQGVLFERDLGIDNLMVIRGDVRDVPMSYFQGIKNVVNPTITLDNGSGESNSLTLTLTMRSLPNGTKDELNLVTGDYVQRLDERPYQEGDIESDNLLTDGVTTIYPLSSPRRRRLNLEWSNGVLKAFEGTTNVTSEAEMLKPYLVVKLATSTLEDLLSKLKEENTGLLATVDKLEEDNLTTMIAVTEVFETVLVMLPFRMDEGISMGSTLKGGGSQMVEVYVTLILKGKKTIDQVPVVIRSQVEQMLKDLQTL